MVENPVSKSGMEARQDKETRTDSEAASSNQSEAGQTGKGGGRMASKI